MHPSWIIESHKIWLHGDDVDVPQSIKTHRLPPFAGVVVCVSGIGDVARRLEIHQEVTKGGGTYVKQLERPVKVTHLLCGNTSEAESEKVRYAQKFNDMREAQIHIVWEDWFWDSLRFGGRFNEERYLVSNPRPSPRALLEGAFFNVIPGTRSPYVEVSHSGDTASTIINCPRRKRDLVRNPECRGLRTRESSRRPCPTRRRGDRVG